jgi:hypothetical protein
VDEALQIVDRTRKRWLKAELYRHKGQLFCGKDTEAAEELHRKALNVAAEQGAKLWEIACRPEPRPAPPRPGSPRRSPLSARAGLRLVHRRLRHPDLKDAKVLLDELEGRV